MSVATTKMSSRGQVVIPEEIRNLLGLIEGSQFVVMGQGDTVILKTITPPSKKHFKEMLESISKSAKAAGMKKSDLKKAINKTRQKR